MPEDGSKPVDVAVLADSSAQLELAVPLSGLTRLGPLLAATDGTARARLAFARDRGHVVADVAVEGELALRCQRCLEVFRLPVRSRSRVALVADESKVESLPEELESALAPEGRMRLRDLVEEELLLAVPRAPRHVEGPCAALAEAGGTVTEAPATQRPFAALAGMLGSATKNQ